MTITTTVSRVDYIAGGGVGDDTFPYTFKIFAAANLKVYVAAVLKTLAVDYNLTGVGVDGGGNVVFVAGSIPAAAAAVALVRDLPLTQEVDYTALDKFPAETHEGALDRLTMMIQEMDQHVDTLEAVIAAHEADPSPRSIVILSSDYPTLAGAEAAAIAGDLLLVIDKNWDVGAATTLASNVLRVPGGSFTKSGIGTLAFSGSFENPSNGQAFIDFAAGDVTFGAGAVEKAYAEWWGAKPDGTTESALAIRCAVASVSSIGGEIYLQAGSYYLNSYDSTAISTAEYGCVALPSNATFAGASRSSTVLKLSNTLEAALFADKGAGARISFIGTRAGTSGQIVRDLKFDWNGILLSKALSTFAMVNSAGGKILIERLYGIENPGQWYIIIETDGTIRDCFLGNCGGNVAGNAVCIDMAFIYLKGKDNLVENCEIGQTSTPLINASGIEVHATNTEIRNNKFSNLWPAIYVGYQSADVSYNVKIHHNHFKDNYGGIYFVDETVGTKIQDNYFENNYYVAVGLHAIMTGRDNTTGVDSGVQDGLIISGNNFTNDDRIQVAGLQNSIIKGNVIKGANIGIELLGSANTTKNVLIDGNQFIDPPSYVASYIGQIQLSGGAAGYSPIFQDIIIQNNLFEADRGSAAPTNQWAMVVNADPAFATLTNIVSHNNEAVNLQGRLNGTTLISAVKGEAHAYTPVWGQVTGTGPVLVAGTLTGWEKIEGKVCTVTFRLTIATGDTFGDGTAAWKISLPYAANATHTTMPIMGRAADTDPAYTDYIQWGTIPAGESYVTFGLDGGSTRAGYPFTWADGDILEATFSYLID